MVVELRSFSFMSPDSGFLIAAGRLAGPVPDIPAPWAGRFNKDRVTVKGASPSLCNISAVGSVVELTGTWAMDPKFGLQFQFTTAREAMPSSVEALLAYLAAGRIKGVGPALAKQIVERFGASTFDVLDGATGDLTAISGITANKADDILSSWKAKRSLYQMTAFFGQYGIGEIWVPRIIEAMGVDGLEARVRANPYMLTTIDGIGFASADKMALALGVDPNSPKRITAMLSHLLREYTGRQGHTAQPVNEWIREASRTLCLPAENLHAAAREIVESGEVVVRNLPVRTSPNASQIMQCVSPKNEHRNELSAAADLARLRARTRPHQPEQVLEMQSGLASRRHVLDPSQVDGARGVLSSSVSVLTGGPGTGKTTTLKSIIDIADAMGLSVVLAAPTGRAAKRMEEAIGRPAATLHRTLGYNPSKGFTYGRHKPLVGDIFVVDEASMIDNSLAASLLRAIPDGARLIFVGDVDQLPPVGAGDFLKDLIASAAASVFRLNRIHRQAEGSQIAVAASCVLAGRLPPPGSDPAASDFSWIQPPASTDDVNEFIKNACCALVDGFLQSGFKKSDIQILSPQKDGITGVAGLNEALRWRLNEKHSSPPPSDEEDFFPFAVGDRVMVTKNNAEKDIYNGDMAVVKSVDETVVMKMEDGREVEIDRAECRGFQFGYAITVHKSQGGERPVVIMPISPSHQFSMTQNLLYTGITRGRSKVVLVGPAKTVVSALRKQGQAHRLTGLVQEIQAAKPAPSSRPKP